MTVTRWTSSGVLKAAGAQQVRIYELGHVVANLAVEGDEAIWAAPAAGEKAARGFFAEALDANGAVLETTAFDVARHWSDAPRYGFLCNFNPGEVAEEAMAGLNRLHINVVQYIGAPIDFIE